MNGVPFEFDEKCFHAFTVLKEKLTSTLIVDAPNWDLLFELMCDASDYVVGVVLGKRVENVFRMIYYVIRTLNDSHVNYATTEKELLAIVFAFDKFRPCLIGNKIMLIKIKENNEVPWFADYANFLAANIVPPEMSRQQLRKFYSEGIDFMGPFQSSYNNKYILLVVNYVLKWVEAAATPTNDGKLVMNFLQKNIFTRFGTPRAILSAEGTRFCNKQFDALLAKYGVRHRTTPADHPQSNGQMEVSNREVKIILEKTVNSSRKDWSNKLDDALWLIG
ncbi:uncharacterized protein LOC133779338 [Humulus lupulus]|uniref:uncharacterized protein LOC133779338 n=1 Tax=Humulus lupulus TaxID=3486 RepID=UPI002B413647|nr:uncharacterized protein LOC133779338 [Humulus lupulus]